MIPRRFLSPVLGAAAVLAAGSAALTARSLVRAVALEPLPRARAVVGRDSMTAPPSTRLAPELAGALVDHDPFRPDRRRPRERFRLPGDRVTPSDTAPSPAPAAAITLLGTAVIGDGGFALCQRGADPPKLVRVGERIGDLTLRRVLRGRAVFRSGDNTVVELRTVPAVQTAPVASAGT